jgi:single-stranded-DNA-specific exonuclease
MPRWSKATKRSRSTSRTPQSSKKTAAPAKAFPPPTPSEAAFEAALRTFGSGRIPARHPSSTDDFVERIFENSENYLRDPYSTIGDAARFHTKIAGVSFEGRQDVIAGLRADALLELKREPDNPHDRNAIAVHYGSLQLGFFNRRLAAHIAPLIDAGVRYRARIASLTGGNDETRHRGVNIFVERDAIARARVVPGAAVERLRDEGELEQRICRALIGERQPHAAQRGVLDRIEKGRNTLAVMGTGRGKSFCFQFSAALRAFDGGAKTLVIYPLRALANDQYEALRRTLDPLGLRCYRANGSIESDERAELFAALASGTWDVVLATPEFLEFHRDAFTGLSVPSFVVVDEAHHLAESRHRPAYARLATAIQTLGSPQVLGLTATAGDEAFGRIVEDLRINAWVVDPTIRENLHVVDARGTKDKIAYLAKLFEAAPVPNCKGIVYCNSRSEATKIAQRLRKTLGNTVVFYHAKMPNAERLNIERSFREGRLGVVVATSAFGEGIDLPDVRDVVLYHLNFDFGEFNQQAGRAGRDGEPARIHLLYGEHDRGLNQYLIDIDSPSLATLREIYRGTKKMAHGGLVRSDNAAIAGTLGIRGVEDRTIAAALRIFADSELIDAGEDDDGRYVRFLPVSGKVQMERNERYAEGEAIRELFTRFSNFALSASAETLERIINRPIYPSGVDLQR